MAFTVINQPLGYKLKSFLKYHRKTLAIIGALLAVMLLVMGFTFCANDLDTPVELPSGWARKLIDTFIVRTITETLPSDSVIVTHSGDEWVIGGQHYKIEQYVSPIRNVVTGYAIAIAIVLWCVSLGTAHVNGSAYREILLKRFIVLCVTLACIAYAFPITENICNIGANLAEKMAAVYAETPAGSEEYSIFGSDPAHPGTADQKYIDDVTAIKDELKTKRDNEKAGKLWLGQTIADIRYEVKYDAERLPLEFKYSYVEPYLAFWLLLIPFLVHWICWALISVMVLMRGVEIVILCCFAPIPFALVSDSQLGNGAGARFLKNIGAVSLQGAVMLAIMYIGNTMLTTDISSLFTGEGYTAIIDNYSHIWRGVVVIPVMEVLLMFRSGSLSQKVMGLS